MIKYLFLFTTLLSLQITSAQPIIINTIPTKNSLNVLPASNIQITFSENINEATLIDTSTILVRGSQSGLHTGIITYDNGAFIATYNSNTEFKHGEIVTVTLTNGIKNLSNISMINSYNWNFTIQANTAPSLFISPISLSSGLATYSIAPVDVDKDGDIDIVTANFASNNISVIKNNGDGTFLDRVNYTTGNSPYSVTLVDVDKDGDMDVVTANYDSHTISILKNNGDGTFATKVDYATGSQPRSVVTVDIDGDGNIDIITANSDANANSISVLKNNGNGTFAAKVDYTTSSRPYAVVSSDIDGDGDMDIVTANYAAHTISILKNNGNGVFAAKVDYSTGNFPTSLTTADIDNDGDMDVVTLSINPKTISVLKNNGVGTFSPKTDYPTGNSTSGPRSIASADVDGDGDMDLLTANVNSKTVSVLKNDGTGGFSNKLDFNTPAENIFVTTADISGDGKMDMLVGYSNSSFISLHKNIFAIEILPASNITDASAKLQGSVYAENLSTTIHFLYGTTPGVYTDSILATPSPIFGDSVTTVSAIPTNLLQGTKYYYTIAKNNTNGYVRGGELNFTTTTFIPTTVFPSSNSINVNPTSNIQITFNKDVNPATLNNTTIKVIGSQTGIHTGNITYNNGTFTATFNPNVDFKSGEKITVVLTTGIQNSSNIAMVNPYSWDFIIRTEIASNVFTSPASITTGSGTFSIVTSDIDKDGDMDIVSANLNSNTISVIKNNGDETFSAKTDYVAGNAPYSITSSDFDGDGNIDIVTANYGSNTISVFKNNGDGTFAAKTDYSTGLQPRSVITVDIEGDGDMDIVTANSDANTNSISIFENNGNGIFSAKVDYTTGTSPYSLTSADVDGDGDMDMITANYSSQNISVLKNNGNKTFAQKVDYWIGSFPSSITTNDVDNDGDMDMITVNINTSTISVFKNNNGTFSTKTDYSIGTGGPRSIASTDMDGDGDIDILTANVNSNTISLLKNNGLGAFSTKLDFNTSTENIFITSADVTGDGKMDMLVGYGNSAFISIYKNIFSLQTLAATNITDTSATIHGLAHSENLTTNIRFIYGTTSGVYTDSIFATPSTVVGDSFTTVSASITGLTQGKYYYRVAKNNSNGYVRGEEMNFQKSIRITSSSINGTITPNGNTTISYGGTQTYTYLPNPNYHFDSVLVNGVKNIDSTTSYTFTNVTSPHTIVAHFSNTYSITSSAVNGTITPNGNTMVTYGNNQTFTYLPNVGYHFDSIVVDGVKNMDSTTSYTFTNVTSPRTITAYFSINKYTIVPTVTNGTIIPNVPVQVNHGNSQTFTYTPNTGYHFSSVIVGGIENLDSTESFTYTNITSSDTIKVVFDANDPIKLTSFIATTKQNKTELQWSTATEINNFGFEIQVTKKEKEEWQKVGFVEGNGSTNTPQNYVFINKNTFAGKYLYRLKQIDKDGKFEYSNSIEVEVAAPKTFSILQNYPNPFNPTTTIQYEVPHNALVMIKVYNVLGEEIATLVNEEKAAGVYEVQFDGSKLPSGMYFYELITQKFSQIKKMMLVK